MISKGTESMRDRIRQRAKERQANQGGLSTLTLPEGVELYKPEKGPVEFDILPYRISVDNHPDVKKGDLWYRRIYYAHRNVGPEEKFLICPRTVGKRCPICEEYQKLKKDPNADEEMVDGLRPKERELFNIVLKDGDGSVMILDISTFLFGKLLEKEINEGDDANAAFPDLVGGKTLKVRWEAKSMGTNKFVEAGRIDFVDREDIDESALDAVVDLDKAMKILSYEEIEKIFQAGGDEVQEEERLSTRTDRPVPSTGKLLKRALADEEEEDQIPGLEVPLKKEKPVANGEAPDCIACDGTGKTSKGKTCPICGGSGKDEDDPVQRAEDAPETDNKEEQEEEVKPAKRVIGKAKEKEETPSTGRRVIRRG